MEVNKLVNRGEKKSPNRVALVTIDALLAESPLTPEEQAAVAINAAVMAISRMPELRESRGKIINKVSDEFKKRLQKYLPIYT